MIVTASVLNVRSGPGTSFRVLGKLYLNDTVEAVEASEDWAWVAPGGGWVSRDYLAPESVRTPAGLSGIVAMFGDPAAPACSAGRVQLPAPLKLGWSSASITRFACHVKLEETFAGVFREIHVRGLWPQLQEFGGCFNDRPIKGSSKRSTHAWGIAVDLNPATNQMGTQGDILPGIVKAFEEAGFFWGGRFHGAGRDPMHFQFAIGY